MSSPVTSVTVSERNLNLQMRYAIRGLTSRLMTSVTSALLRQVATGSLRDAVGPGLLLRERTVTRRRRDGATSRQSAVKGQLSATDEVGFGFSAGGLLFPYFIGVSSSLHDNGLLTRTHFLREGRWGRHESCVLGETKMAGSSAGSLISAFYHAGMSPEDLMEGCLRVAGDCRVNGTRGRLRSVLAKVAQELLPEDAHLHCTGKAFISITRLYPFRNELISEFETRDDLLLALLASCHVPVWFDNSILTNYKESLCMDGGLTNLIPNPPVARVIRISCFPMKGWGEAYRVRIAPDCFGQSKYTMRELLNMALQPPEEEQLFELYEMGRRDAQDYVDQYTIPSLDEESGPELLFDDGDDWEEMGSNLWSRMRSVFTTSKEETRTV